MMPSPVPHRRTALLLLSTLVCQIGSGVLLYDQARTVGFLRSDALPLAQKVGEMEGRLQLLTRQVEQAEASAAEIASSPQEAVRSFVIPRGAPEARAVSLMDHLGVLLREQDQLKSLSAIEVTEASPTDLPDGVQARDLHVSAVMSADGWQALRRMLRLSGHVTVRDTLSQTDLDRLLAASERMNPAAAATLTEVLRMDLLAYAADPTAVEDRLLAALGSDASGAVSAALGSSLLQDARALAPIGTKLQQAELWPLPLMTLNGLELKDLGGGEWFAVDVGVRAYGRE